MTASDPALNPSGWYPDPFGRHEHRYWDGGQWTENVATAGSPSVDPPIAAAPAVAKAQAPGIRDLPRQEEVATLFTSSTLVVKQRKKLVEVNAEYDLFDRDGGRLGAVREVGKTIWGKALSVSGLGGSDTKHRLEVFDADGLVVMSFFRPEKFFRSKMIVTGADGRELGRIAQKSLGILAGKERFDLESGRQKLGSIHAEGTDAWNFAIRDTAGTEIARISRTWSGQAVEIFTNGDNYVVQSHRPLQMPLSALVVAAAVALDMALRQGGN